LNTTDGFEGKRAAEIRIVRETLPIATTQSYASKRANNGSECNIDALGPEFSAHVQGSLISEVFVPSKIGLAFG